MIISGLEANKMYFKTALFTNKAKQAFYIVLNCIVFYDVNLTISPLKIYKMDFHEDVTYQHSLFVNNSNNNQRNNRYIKMCVCVYQ